VSFRNPIQLKYCDIGFKIRLGGIFWTDKTSEGFTNDFFGSYNYVELRTNLQGKIWDNCPGNNLP